MPAVAMDDVGLALHTLRGVCRQDDAPPASRATAARTLLEFYGTLGANRTKLPPDGSKADAELTRSELVSRAKALRASDPVNPF
jgi:hypothetical protein